MKTVHVVLLTIILTGKMARADDRPASCWEHAMTQLEMNQCAAEDGSKADTELNDVYRRIMKEYSDDPAFLTAMKDAQRAWLKFRDAEIAAIFPHQQEAGYYGTVAPMCESMWRDSLTSDRTRQLRRWLKGTTEGDACSGSIKLSKELPGGLPNHSVEPTRKKDARGSR